MNGYLNIREMLLGNPVRLRYVKRFSTARVLQPDTVAEHSYFVCLYCLLLAEWVNVQPPSSRKGEVDIGKLLARAVMHDFEEAVTGDLPRPFKYSTKKLQAALDEASAQCYDMMVERLTEHDRILVHLVQYWKLGKDATQEGRILDLADFMTVLSFMLQEKIDWNLTMAEHKTTMTEYFKRFQEDDYDFLRPVVVEVGNLVEEALRGKD